MDPSYARYRGTVLFTIASNPLPCTVATEFLKYRYKGVCKTIPFVLQQAVDASSAAELALFSNEFLPDMLSGGELIKQLRVNVATPTTCDTPMLKLSAEPSTISGKIKKESSDNRAVVLSGRDTVNNYRATARLIRFVACVRTEPSVDTYSVSWELVPDLPTAIAVESEGEPHFYVVLDANKDADALSAITRCHARGFAGLVGYNVVVRSEAARTLLSTAPFMEDKTYIWVAFSARVEGTFRWIAGPLRGQTYPGANWHTDEPNNLVNEGYTVLISADLYNVVQNLVSSTSAPFNKLKVVCEYGGTEPMNGHYRGTTVVRVKSSDAIPAAVGSLPSWAYSGYATTLHVDQSKPLKKTMKPFESPETTRIIQSSTIDMARFEATVTPALECSFLSVETTTSGAVSLSSTTVTKEVRKRRLVLEGKAPIAQYLAAIATIHFEACGNLTKEYHSIVWELIPAMKVSYRMPESGELHFYEMFTDKMTWSAARLACASRKLLGLRGYLVTITSDAENTAINANGETTGWLCASRNRHGVWRWWCGPEAGSLPGTYSNPDAKEPENVVATRVLNAVYMWNKPSATVDGKWDDVYTDKNLMYICEYGGFDIEDANADTTRHFRGIVHIRVTFRTPTDTPTPSMSYTSTLTTTESRTRATASESKIASYTASITHSMSESITDSVSGTSTQTNTESVSGSSSFTGSETPTASGTSTQISTESVSGSSSVTGSEIPTASGTSTQTNTETASGRSTVTGSHTDSVSGSSTQTSTNSASGRSSVTRSVSSAGTHTASFSGSSTQTQSVSATASAMASISRTSTVSQTMDDLSLSPSRTCSKSVFATSSVTVSATSTVLVTPGSRTTSRTPVASRSGSHDATLTVATESPSSDPTVSVSSTPFTPHFLEPPKALAMFGADAAAVQMAVSPRIFFFNDTILWHIAFPIGLLGTFFDADTIVVQQQTPSVMSYRLFLLEGSNVTYRRDGDELTMETRVVPQVARTYTGPIIFTVQLRPTLRSYAVVCSESPCLSVHGARGVSLHGLDDVAVIRALNASAVQTFIVRLSEPPLVGSVSVVVASNLTSSTLTANVLSKRSGPLFSVDYVVRLEAKLGEIFPVLVSVRLAGSAARQYVWDLNGNSFMTRLLQPYAEIYIADVVTTNDKYMVVTVGSNMTSRHAAVTVRLFVACDCGTLMYPNPDHVELPPHQRVTFQASLPSIPRGARTSFTLRILRANEHDGTNGTTGTLTPAPSPASIPYETAVSTTSKWVSCDGTSNACLSAVDVTAQTPSYTPEISIPSVVFAGVAATLTVKLPHIAGVVRSPTDRVDILMTVNVTSATSNVHVTLSETSLTYMFDPASGTVRLPSSSGIVSISCKFPDALAADSIITPPPAHAPVNVTASFRITSTRPEYKAATITRQLWCADPMLLTLDGNVVVTAKTGDSARPSLTSRVGQSVEVTLSAIGGMWSSEVISAIENPSVTVDMWTLSGAVATVSSPYSPLVGSPPHLRLILTRALRTMTLRLTGVSVGKTVLVLRAHSSPVPDITQYLDRDDKASVSVTVLRLRAVHAIHAHRQQIGSVSVQVQPESVPRSPLTVTVDVCGSRASVTLTSSSAQMATIEAMPTAEVRAAVGEYVGRGGYECAVRVLTTGDAEFEPVAYNGVVMLTPAPRMTFAEGATLRAVAGGATSAPDLRGSSLHFWLYNDSLALNLSAPVRFFCVHRHAPCAAVILLCH
eukprot:PhM_4_TR15886/c3_g1_i1/m.16970